ncbi:amino acid adenylation domain-containing protein [Kitasatospora sp. NBC_01539]|uniref:amino acid adenylation domain-containing protein n=1 Tax=Kitasatospora sp. NBC_01539 TaxID=2903577 RepID=UPI00386010D4
MEHSHRVQQSRSGSHRVVANADGQHALWPDRLPVPEGWHSVFGPADRETCRAAVEARWQGLRPTGAGNPGRTVHGLFREQAARRPGATAVVCDDGPLTYGELDGRSDRLAEELRALGVGPDVVVPVCVERSGDMVVALLAALKAGGAFLPLDPAHPDLRLARLAADAGGGPAVTSREHAGLFPQGVLVEAYRSAGPSTSVPPPDVTHPDDLAYLIYTSGTTGEPKGVPISHRTMVFTLSRVAEAYGLSPADRVLQLGALGFDTSLEQIFTPLLNGAALVLAGRHPWAPIELAHRLPELGITVADLTPTYWHRLLSVLPDQGRAATSLRLLVVGGDAVPAEDCRTTLARLPGTRLLNAYGLTETGITSTLCEVHPGLLTQPAHAPVPVGRPLLGTYVHVLDPELRPVPPGQRGEVYIGGPGLARGYWKRPGLTAERFLPEPYAGIPGGRMYRTGDTGRWRPDGNLELIGRADDQVKIRGYRVDPGEVESVLGEHPAVAEVRVVAGESTGGRALTAYYTARGARPDDLRPYLAARLPDHLVPSAFVPVDRMPVTLSGKIDRAGLARRGPRHDHTGDSPGTTVQAGLAYLWAQILDVEHVGPDDDFFDLGGNSLLAMEMLARARIMFGIGIDRIRLLTRSLLKDPTLGAFTAVTRDALGALGAGPAENGQQVDFAAEAELGVPVHHGRDATAPRWRQPSDILLTGATGFCGSHLLRALLETTDARVHCLVRAPDAEHGMERLRAAQQRYLLRDLHSDRVVPVVGDLAEPLLGLGRQGFERLAGTVDLIHHLGGQVNFLYPYHQLRAANVAGTREIIRLAGHSRAIPVHYLSSMAVLAGYGPAGIRNLTEESPLAHPEQLSVGYVESKWVAEALLHHAATAGLPVTVHRVNDVTGDLRHGVINPGTELSALIRYLWDSGTAPDVDLPLDFVPADAFTRALALVSTREPAEGKVLHLTNPAPAGLADLAARITARGRPVEQLPYADWVRRLISFANTHPTHPITAFVPLFVDRAEGTELTISEMYFRPTFPEFTRTNAEKALAGAGITLPPVDAELLDFYLDRLEASGELEHVA